MRIFRLLTLASLIVSTLPTTSHAQLADTTWVQTFTWEAQNNPNTPYDSPGRRWFDFPPSANGESFRKILMYHTLKCFDDGTAGNLGWPCGEWDYLTYNFLFEHTGMLDSTLVTHPHYLVDNSGFISADLHYAPEANTWLYEDQHVVVDAVNSESMATPDGTEISETNPFGTAPASRIQYLYKADELLAAGFTAGPIHQISFPAVQGSEALQLFSLRMKQTSVDELINFDTAGLVEVYSWDESFDPNTPHTFFLNQPFIWNGTSNLLLDLSYTDPSQTEVPSFTGQQTDYASAVRSSGSDRYVSFDGNDFVNVPPSAFSEVSDEVTISFWLYGNPDAQPMDGTCFEGVNAQNQRVLNAHIPWSNSRIYWDAGSEGGGYDRIDKAANTSDYEGRWNHFAFTKNSTTGVMKIYLNGVEWHSGTNLDNLMDGIVKFTLGGAAGWSNYYNGRIDEFAVWNVALDESTIAAWMFKDLDASHPFWNNLQVYYTFDEPDGSLVVDHSGHGRDGILLGNAARILHRGADLFRNGETEMVRPQTTFYTGDYSTHMETNTGEWIQPIPPVSVAEYEIDNYAPIPLSVEYQWLSGYSYTYDVDGTALDSTLIGTDYVLVNDDLSYYQAPFEVLNRYELGRYITPYGIQLDLGEDGWTWIYDVTDFAPLLRDSVELEAGNWQELLNLKFAFIGGEVPREVQRVENFWVGNYGLSTMDTYVTDKEFSLNEDEEMLKLRTVATGHGFGSGNDCAEFCSNTHSVVVNGEEQWSWEIMHDCADNALYPQGGTWVYARSAWCPGKEGKQEEFELTPFLQNGSVTVDYNIDEDPYGNYVFESQMVTYGGLTHQLDAEIDKVLAPNQFKLYSRWNPMCDNPVIRLRNQGAQVLSQCTIEFGIVGGPSETYEWTGELDFDQWEDVSLLAINSDMWSGDSAEDLVFFAHIIGVNGLAGDEQEENNYATSVFHRPPTYTYGTGEDDDNRLIIILKTNASYWQNECWLYDINDNVVFHRDDYNVAGETYRDTLYLNEGCYHFVLEDTGDDGISFWANDDGNGQCRLDRVQGLDFKNFEGDFGDKISQYFHWKTDLVGVNEHLPATVGVAVYPNPASEVLQVELGGFTGNTELNLVNTDGKIVLHQRVNAMGENSPYLRVGDLAAGIYTLQAYNQRAQASVRVVVLH